MVPVRLRRAVTLIEILVILLVIGLLFGLLIPALHSRREAARRSRCAENLNQIGIALGVYHSTYHRFPMGGSKSPMNGPGDYKPWGGWSAQSMLLPYLDQQLLYDSANFSWASDGPTNPDGPAILINGTVRNTVISTFLCPADPESGIMRFNNYYACFGTTTTVLLDRADPFSGSGHAPTGSSGLFTLWVSYGVADCTDGTSHTIAFSEALVGRPGSGGDFQGNAVVGLSDSTPTCQLDDAFRNPGAVLAALDQCHRRSRDISSVKDDKGHFWTHGAANYSMFNTIQTPNDRRYPVGGCRIGCPGCNPDGSFSAAANSGHSDGVSVLMADGAVKFIREGINRATWWGLGTRAGGETIDADTY